MNRILAIAGAILCALFLSACATWDGVGARLAASDVSIVETALFIQRVRGVDLDPANREDRIIIYRAVDTVVEWRRGDITEAEAIAEIDDVLEDAEE